MVTTLHNGRSSSRNNSGKLSRSFRHWTRLRCYPCYPHSLCQWPAISRYHPTAPPTFIRSNPANSMLALSCARYLAAVSTVRSVMSKNSSGVMASSSGRSHNAVMHMSSAVFSTRHSIMSDTCEVYCKVWHGYGWIWALVKSGLNRT